MKLVVPTKAVVVIVAVWETFSGPPVSVKVNDPSPPYVFLVIRI